MILKLSANKRKLFVLWVRPTWHTVIHVINGIEKESQTVAVQHGGTMES